jgi:hypothetical protein
MVARHWPTRLVKQLSLIQLKKHTVVFVTELHGPSVVTIRVVASFK